jgi:hypothetical protein
MSGIYLGSPLLMDIASWFYRILLLSRRLRGSPRSFIFNGRNYTYFEHAYNGTWMNERAVEIPLIWDIVQVFPPEKVLEVGNVLSHYFPVRHTIVDKYERRGDVVRQDILEMPLHKQYDRIVSISTVEHIGWDEVPRVPSKCILAIERMKQLLSIDGQLIVTVPLGYNPYLDKSLFSGELKCDQEFYFKRLTRYEWLQVNKNDVIDSKYGEAYRSTDGLGVCIWFGARQS